MDEEEKERFANLNVPKRFQLSREAGERGTVGLTIGDADLKLVKAGQYVELGNSNVGIAVNQVTVLELHNI